VEFKAKKRQLKVSIGEDAYMVSFPTMKTLSAYRQSIDGLDPQKDLAKLEDALSGMLASLGLPKEAQEELEGPDYTEIVRLLTEAKK